MSHTWIQTSRLTNLPVYSKYKAIHGDLEIYEGYDVGIRNSNLGGKIKIQFSYISRAGPPVSKCLLVQNLFVLIYPAPPTLPLSFSLHSLISGGPLRVHWGQELR